MEQMSVDSGEVLYDAVHRCEPLQDGVGDHLGWNAVSAVAGRLLAHPFSLPRPA
ncbi:MAG: hypothetical protein QF681_10325 [Vicinamibacterales bacterium]|nr:hypothetical protein [Vicinamibacterales bacterium]